MLPASDVERVSGLLRRIEDRLSDPLSPQWAARDSAWALSHFHRKFTAVVGDSFLSYVRARRLHRAAGDLIGTRLSVSRIADGADFAHTPAFYKAFTQRY